MVDDRIWLCTLVLGSLLVISDVGSAQQKRIYIANDDHTDYVWSASEDQYRVAFLQMLDYYLDQADQTDSLPSDFQSRFNADGNLWLWTYQHNRTADQFSRLISRIRDGHITIPLQTLVLCYGAMPAEAVIRSMYYAGRIERQYALQFELANAMENATLPYGLPSLWAGSGARYSWMGVCGCASNVMDLGHRKFELYHAVGPDGRSVLMKWHSLSGSNQSSGGYAEARNPSAAVDFASTDSVFLSRYPYDQVIGLFGKGWDDVSTLTTAFPIAAQSSSNAERRVIVSNELDFFKDLEQSAPPELIPSWAGGFGNEWDTYSATMAEVTANVKRAVESLRTAEALATVVSVLNPGFLSGREAMTDSAFESLGLYYEHDWTAGGVASAARPAFERRLSAQISRYVSALENDAAVKMGTMIANPSAGVRFCVFNPLSWSRTDIADLPYQGSGPLKVIDVGSGGEVRSQLVVKNGVNVVRILASNVPSVGYRVYEIQQGPSAFTDSCASISNGGSTFANDKYAITVNGHGALASIIDKRDGNRDLVHSIGGLAVNDIGSGSGTPAVESIGPVSASIVVTAGGTPTHRTRITVYSSVDRIDMEDEITANFGDAVTTYAFGFNLSGFTVRHEEVGGIAIANLVSYGGNYSDRNARYSYLTMNHFVDLSETGRGVTISNWDSPFFKLGSSSDNTLDVATPQIRALVGGRIDANLGIANQGGDSYFLNRYALQRHGAFDQAAAMRMALEHQNPLYAMPVTGGPDGVLPQDTLSALTISNPSVILWALKPAEDGISQGVIARVWNCSSSSEQFALGFPNYLVNTANRTTHIETVTGPAQLVGESLSETLASQWMQTYLIGVQPITGISSKSPMPEGYSLSQNFPNPFNGESQIQFRVPESVHVRMRLFNILGQVEATLLDDSVSPGTHHVNLNTNALGMGSGVYFCRMEAGRFVSVIKVVLIK